ncbi:MAG: serine hydrolase domain-containing protein [Desulfobacterales bacterium]
MHGKGLIRWNFPGAQILAARAGNIFRRAYGIADVYTNRKVTLETVFDLASHKTAGHHPGGHAAGQARLFIDHALCTVLPEFSATDKADIRISQLLYHTSGLPDYRPYYRALKNLPIDRRKDALRQKLVSEPLVAETGKVTSILILGS